MSNPALQYRLRTYHGAWHNNSVTSRTPHRDELYDTEELAMVNYSVECNNPAVHRVMVDIVMSVRHAECMKL
jgi:hypothetical protein